MNELLKKLLESEVLSEDTQKELKEAFEAQIQEAMTEAVIQAETAVRAELATQWIGERDALITALDEKVEDLLAAEVEELREDIAAFRDLEAEYASRLVEAKQEMATELQNDLAELIEKLDSFLELRLAAEFEELREDIQASKKQKFGRTMFEAFVAEYQNNFVNVDSTEASLREARETLNAERSKRKEIEKQLNNTKRAVKMETILRPLNGKQREIMETILRSVPTEGLEEGYKTFIGRVLKETPMDKTEKESSVLAESESAAVDQKVKAGQLKLKRGNARAITEESEDLEDVTSNGNRSRVAESYAHLAGL